MEVQETLSTLRRNHDFMDKVKSVFDHEKQKDDHRNESFPFAINQFKFHIPIQFLAIFGQFDLPGLQNDFIICKLVSRSRDVLVPPPKG